ncbi:YvrJ family protein, partial [Phascolarctobacterium sp.]
PHQSRHRYRAGLTPMDTKEIFSAVGNFGFPMVLSWYLLLRMEQRLDKLTGCLNELSRAIISNHREL